MEPSISSQMERRMTPDREAAAGLVEYYNSVAKTGVLITYTAQINAKPTADLNTTLLSELERVGMERAAKALEPIGPRPCDCTRCDCGNVGDAAEVANWDACSENAARIRALK